MKYLISPALITISVYFCDKYIEKRLRNLWFYPFCFFLFMFMMWACSGNAGEYKPMLEQLETMAYRLTPEQRIECYQLIQEHFYQASICSEEAEKACGGIPVKAYEIAARASTRAITAGILTRNITITAISAAEAMLEAFLSQFSDAWDAISSNLHCAEYNVQMAKFYQEVLNQDGK